MDIKNIYPVIINLAWETILLVDYPSGRIVDANNKACESLGYTRNELLKLFISDIDHVYDTEKLNELIHLIGVGNDTVIETTQIRKDGSTFPVEINIGVIAVEENKFFLAFVRDITYREEAILESISEGVFTVDFKTWEITFFNHAATQITGVRRDDALGKHCSVVFNSSLCEADNILKKTFKTGKPIVNETTHFTRADGRKIPISVSTAILKNCRGNIIGGAATFRDLSEIEGLRKKLKLNPVNGNFTSHSPSMHKIINLIPTVAESSSSVLIQGETGTGKEVLAKTLHSMSLSKDGPFIAVNCGALPDTLLESELFGYKKGAFTGAVASKLGRFALANNGTIFLDEIGDISPALQVRLLRVLQDHVFDPLGSTKSEKTNTRVIAASNKNLATLVSEGKFRKDLFYRINILCIDIPPLRNRKEDIPLLADSFIKKFNKKQNKNIKKITPEVLSFFITYNWPGNIRELENIIERAFILCSGDIIKMEHLPDEMSNFSGVIPEGSNMEKIRCSVEIQAIRKALERNKYVRSATAKELGIDKSTLFRKMKKFEIHIPNSSKK